MTKDINMESAARRHLKAGDQLFPTDCSAVAGYLYGISAECACKAMMQDAGINTPPGCERREDPYFAHFPELRTLLRDTLALRKSAVLRRFIENDDFMNNWSTSMRYTRQGETRDQLIKRWRYHAHEAVDCMGT